MPDALAQFRVDGAFGLWEIAAAHPDRVAVVGADGGQTTYGEIGARSDELAAGLQELGVRPGDVVATVMGNEREFVAVQLAASQLGIYLTAVNWHLTAAEIGYILADSGAQVLISSAPFTGAAGRAADEAGLPAARRFAAAPAAGFRDLDELALPDAAPDRGRRRAGETMLYTSGTTGRPKGVRKPLPDLPPEESLARWLPAARRRYGWPADGGSHLVLAPLYHAAPNRWSMTSLHTGGTVVLTEKFDAESTLRLIERHRITSTLMVPTMFHRLLALPDQTRAAHDVSSLTFVLHSAAPCPVHEKRAMLDWWGPVLYEYYSSTEGGGTAVRPGEWLEHPGTVGRAWDGAGIAIFDEAGRELPPGETGLVYIRNNEPFVYHNAPEKTARARREDLFTVGDLGFVDNDGWLFLTDRRADLIISGGVNIYPAEVEEVLLAHPAVADVAVVGLPDDDLGTKVHAVVEAVPEAVPGAALGREIRRFCEQRLARFKRPRTISFRRVPRSATGKLNHSALRRKLLGRQKGDERHVRDSA